MKTKKLITALALCLVFTVFAGNAQKTCNVKKAFPGKQWKERSPERLGVDPVVLDSALSYYKAHSGGAGTDEMAVIRHGYVIWKGPGIGNRHEICSCTKVFTSTVMGVLITREMIEANDLAVKYHPILAKGDQGQGAYKNLRLFDLATMSGGYQGDIGGEDCWQLHLKGLHGEAYACTQKFTIPGKPLFPAGTAWKYNDHDVHMLGYILTKVAGKSLEDVFREAIAGEIGMVEWDWSDYGYRDGMFFNNPPGTPNNLEATEMNEIQCGIWTTPLNFARLGLLYLNKGNWKGKQLLDSSFVEEATSNLIPASMPPFKSFDLTGRYGYYWWTNGIREDGTRPWPSAPPKTATPVGIGGNYCFVIPEWNMVIVRMSSIRRKDKRSSHREKKGDPWEGFFRILKNGIK